LLFKSKIWFANYENEEKDAYSMLKELIDNADLFNKNNDNYNIDTLNLSNLYFWQYNEFGKDDEINTDRDLDLGVMCQDKYNHCPSNSRKSNDMHLWDYGIKLQDCVYDDNAQKSLKDFVVFDNGYIVDQGFWWAYGKEEGISKLGRPISKAFDGTTPCQEFEKGKLLWHYPEGQSSGGHYEIVEHSNSCTSKQYFTDVPTTHTNYEAIKFVKEKEIVKGYDDGTFRPENPINRAEFTKIVLLSKYSQEEIDEKVKNVSYNKYFTDIKNKAWYKNYANFAKQKGFIRGYEQPDKTFEFGGNKNIKFAEASKIIVNTLIEETAPAEEGDWFTPFITKLAEKDVITYPSGKEITRGEMAQIIYEVLVPKAER